MTSPYPALEAFRASLAADEFRLAEAHAPLALDALREYLHDGARLGRALREDVARFRPADEVGRMLCWLFVVTIDAATHTGREGALAAHAASGQPLAAEAGELHAILTAPDFGRGGGPRPIVSKRGCPSP